jgi:TonB family protein
MNKTFYIFFLIACCFRILGQTSTGADSVKIVGSNPQLPATFPGGMTALREYLDNNVTKRITFTQDDTGVLRKCFAKFTIDKNGNVDSVSIVKTSNILRLDSLFIDAIKKMPKWTPATINGQPVAEKWTLPFYIHLK